MDGNGYVPSTQLSLTKSQVGLSNVDNTSDANKPVSTATSSALALKSNLNSRDDVETIIKFGNFKLKNPIIAAPMPDVCESEMAVALWNYGALGIMHRFMSKEDQIKAFCAVSRRIYQAEILDQGTYRGSGLHARHSAEIEQG